MHYLAVWKLWTTMATTERYFFTYLSYTPMEWCWSPLSCFFTDWITYHEVHQLDATSGKVLRSYSTNGGTPMGIVAYDSARQPPDIKMFAPVNNFCRRGLLTTLLFVNLKPKE